MKYTTMSQCNYDWSFSYDSGLESTTSCDRLNIDNVETSYHLRESLHETKDVINWFLTKDNLDSKKIELLCYYTQAWYYALYGKKFIDSDFEAGDVGPYSSKIEKDFSGDETKKFELKNKYIVNGKFSKNDTDFLKRVWDTYGDYTGFYLNELAKREKPYKETINKKGLDSKQRPIITPQSMIDYYQEIYEQ